MIGCQVLDMFFGGGRGCKNKNKSYYFSWNIENKDKKLFEPIPIFKKI